MEGRIDGRTDRLITVGRPQTGVLVKMNYNFKIVLKMQYKNTKKYAFIISKHRFVKGDFFNAFLDRSFAMREFNLHLIAWICRVDVRVSKSDETFGDFCLERCRVLRKTPFCLLLGIKHEKMHKVYIWCNIL